MKIEVSIFENKEMIYMCISSSHKESLSWEVLQGIKNMYYPHLDFIEVYPRAERAINKANVRYLFCVEMKVPDLSDLENADFKTILI